VLRKCNISEANLDLAADRDLWRSTCVTGLKSFKAASEQVASDRRARIHTILLWQLQLDLSVSSLWQNLCIGRRSPPSYSYSSTTAITSVQRRRRNRLTIPRASKRSVITICPKRRSVVALDMLFCFIVVLLNFTPLEARQSCVRESDDEFITPSESYMTSCDVASRLLAPRHVAWNVL